MAATKESEGTSRARATMALGVVMTNSDGLSPPARFT
jgi:hypothetical protein